MYPCVNLFSFHGVEDVSELFDVGIGIIFLFCSFETIKFLILEIEIAVVISLGTVAVLSAALAVLIVMAVVVVDNDSVTV
jgi:hypothetical protein